MKTISLAASCCDQRIRGYFYNEIKVKVEHLLYSAPLEARPTAEALRYMARTKQRRTYLPYTFPAVAGTHLPTPKGWRVQ